MAQVILLHAYYLTIWSSTSVIYNCPACVRQRSFEHPDHTNSPEPEDLCRNTRRFARIHSSGVRIRDALEGATPRKIWPRSHLVIRTAHRWIPVFGSKYLPLKTVPHDLFAR